MNIVDVDSVMRNDSESARLPHEKRFQSGAAFINGTYCSVGEATIPLYDSGFVNCDAVYEKMVVSRGRFFRLQDHYERFARSCEKFRLRNPHTNEEMTAIFSELLRLGGFREAGLFWCVTRGVEIPLKETDTHSNSNGCRFYATADRYLSISTQEQRNRGLELWISTDHTRIQPKAVDPRAKNFHWMDLKLSIFEAHDHGKEWSVLTDANGYLTEAPGANVFVLKEGALYTPDAGCLEGITRKSVIELAKTLGVSVHLTKVHADDLRRAEDAFLTSSAGGVMPVNSVDGILLGNRVGPGELVTKLHNLYWESLWDGWKGTPIDYSGSAL